MENPVDDPKPIAQAIRKTIADLDLGVRLSVRTSSGYPPQVRIYFPTIVGEYDLEAWKHLDSILRRHATMAPYEPARPEDYDFGGDGYSGVSVAHMSTDVSKTIEASRINWTKVLATQVD